YFGGTKLGVSGLIHAYKTATAEALASATVVEAYETVLLQAHFEYLQMNDMMSLVKEYDLTVKEQDFSLDCRFTMKVRKALQEEITEKLESSEGVSVKVIE